MLDVVACVYDPSAPTARWETGTGDSWKLVGQLSRRPCFKVEAGERHLRLSRGTCNTLARMHAQNMMVGSRLPQVPGFQPLLFS